MGTVRAMPHMVALVRIANRAFDRDGDLRTIASALAESTTVVEAARHAGWLDAKGVDADHAGDALAGLPRSVDAALLAVLRDAVDRGVGVVFQWKPGAAVELQVWEAVEDGVGHVGILLVTPRGRNLATGA